MGVAAIGVGNLSGALVEVVLLDRATRRTAGVAPYRPLLAPVSVALVSGGVGWFVCTSGPAGIWTAVAAGALTLGLTLAGLWLACSRDLKDVLRLAARTVRNAIPALHRTPPPNPLVAE
jgi:hypothetical protein